MTIPGIATTAFKDEAKKAVTPSQPKKGKRGGKDNKYCLSLSAFSINNELDNLREEEENAVFVVDKIAIKGEFVAISAPPNGGKTLLIFKGIADSVDAGRIDGEKVYYVNHDDNKPGAICKTEIANLYGINMICSVLASREMTGGGKFSITEILSHKVKKKKVDGEIIILDTYKKFVNVMSKEDQSAFNGVLREFVTMGGTVICLAHTNKNKNADGEYVFNGTSDLPDDCDTAWIIHPTDAAGGKVHTFRFKKGRGVSGEDIALFIPDNDEDPGCEKYQKMFYGVKPCDPVSIEDEEKTDWKRDLQEKCHSVILLIKEELESGSKNRTQLTEAYNESDFKYEVTRRNFDKVLSAFSGDLWHVERIGKERVFMLPIRDDLQ